MRARVAGVVVLLCTTAGCGSAAIEDSGGAAGSDVGEQTAASAWEQFPVDAPTRPFVMVAGGISEPPQGYTTDAAKQAGGAAAFAIPETVPAAPATLDSFPIMGFADAVAAARRAIGGAAVPTVPTMDVLLTRAEFMTDRGSSILPAWLVTIDGATGPIAIVAVDAPARFLGDAPVPIGSDHATIDPAGTTLTLAVVGAAEGTGACTADYRLDVIEHRAYVETAVVETRHAGGDCDLVGYSREVSTTLRQPLGARVLVRGDSGAPIIVSPAADPPATRSPSATLFPMWITAAIRHPRRSLRHLSMPYRASRRRRSTNLRPTRRSPSYSRPSTSLAARTSTTSTAARWSPLGTVRSSSTFRSEAPGSTPTSMPRTCPRPPTRSLKQRPGPCC